MSHDVTSRFMLHMCMCFVYRQLGSDALGDEMGWDGGLLKRCACASGGAMAAKLPAGGALSTPTDQAPT